MPLLAHNESFLYSRFREFYTEVIRLKRLVQTRVVGGAVDEHLDAVAGAPPRRAGAAVDRGRGVVALPCGQEPVVELHRDELPARR